MGEFGAQRLRVARGLGPVATLAYFPNARCVIGSGPRSIRPPALADPKQPPTADTAHMPMGGLHHGRCR